MCTLCPDVEWLQIELSGYILVSSLELFWSGYMYGTSWSLSLTSEARFSKGRGSLSMSKFAVIGQRHWRFPDLSTGVYRVELSGIEEGAGPGSRPGANVLRGRCWVCVGPCEMETVEAKVRAKYGVITLNRFSQLALIEELSTSGHV